jgi:hypothetical protein
VSEDRFILGFSLHSHVLPNFVVRNSALLVNVTAMEINTDLHVPSHVVILGMLARLPRLKRLYCPASLVTMAMDSSNLCDGSPLPASLPIVRLELRNDFTEAARGSPTGFPSGTCLGITCPLLQKLILDEGTRLGSTEFLKLSLNATCLILWRRAGVEMLELLLNNWTHVRKIKLRNFMLSDRTRELLALATSRGVNVVLGIVDAHLTPENAPFLNIPGPGCETIAVASWEGHVREPLELARTLGVAHLRLNGLGDGAISIAIRSADVFLSLTTLLLRNVQFVAESSQGVLFPRLKYFQFFSSCRAVADDWPMLRFVATYILSAPLLTTFIFHDEREHVTQLDRPQRASLDELSKSWRLHNLREVVACIGTGSHLVRKMLQCRAQASPRLLLLDGTLKPVALDFLRSLLSHSPMLRIHLLLYSTREHALTSGLMCELFHVSTVQSIAHNLDPEELRAFAVSNTQRYLAHKVDDRLCIHFIDTVGWEMQSPRKQGKCILAWSSILSRE